MHVNYLSQVDIPTAHFAFSNICAQSYILLLSQVNYIIFLQVLIFIQLLIEKGIVSNCKGMILFFSMIVLHYQ